MSFTRSDAGDETVLRIEGTLDAACAPEIQPLFDALVAERRRQVVIDASSLRLIDSAGVGAIVSLYKRLHAQGGALTVRGLHDQPLAIFRLLRLDRVLAQE